MFELSTSKAHWLNFTNVALGIATLSFVVMVVREILHDLRGRFHGRARIRTSEKHNS
jgi:hypothetical protein